MYNFCKKEKIKSLNRQFREIKFPANTIFLRDREIKDSRNVPRKFSQNLSPAKIKENKVFVKYAVEISNLPLFYSRDACRNKGYRIVWEKQCHCLNKCILFKITRMRSVNRRIAALFYASVMKVLTTITIFSLSLGSPIII